MSDPPQGHPMTTRRSFLGLLAGAGAFSALWRGREAPKEKPRPEPSKAVSGHVLYVYYSDGPAIKPIEVKVRYV